MHWGHHKTEGVSRSDNRAARKDAKEFARAKMFYGESAGTRRKLIKNKVEGKSKNNPGYKKAFDDHLSRQDMSKHTDKAIGERKRRTARKSTAKTARGIGHLLNGNSQYASAAAIGLFGAATIAYKTGAAGHLYRNGRKKMTTMRTEHSRRSKSAEDFLRSRGMKF
jgi:hypothetical protein